MSGRLNEQLEELQHIVTRADVRARVLPENALEAVSPRDEAACPELVLDLTKEVLLASAADQVGVEVAEPDVIERVRAAQALVARLDVDRRVGSPAVDRRMVVVEVAPI